jgi:subtilisin family serine protease
MAILDPELTALLVKAAYQRDHPDQQVLDVRPEDPIYIGLEFTGDIAALEQAGFNVGSYSGNIAYGMTDLAGLEALASHPQVESIERQRRPHLQLDDSVPDIKADQVWGRIGAHFSGYTGRDVIVGIVDTGIDFRHQVFRKSDGKTRILKIWDQTLTAQGGETVPGPITTPTIAIPPASVPLNYGVEYDANQINDTLENSSPAIPVRHLDQHGHGTHVAGIAAGDGSQSGGCHDSFHYIGVATEADLIVVRMRRLTPGDPKTIPTGSNFKLDAIRYILEQARVIGKPAVINLSLGLFTELMDGTSKNCRDVDALLTSNSTGRAIVFAAGNDGDKKFHATGTVPAGDSDILLFAIKTDQQQGDRDIRSLVIRYSGTNLQVKLTSPVSGNNGIINFVASGNPASLSPTANGGGAGSSVTVNNQANRIDITITPPTTAGTATGPNVAGTWAIELKDAGATPTATNFDAFCTGGSSHDPLSPNFLDHDTVHTTLDEDASGTECISVGSYKIGGRLSTFSSRGPTFDAAHRTKPEICAPGEDITSAGLPKDRNECFKCCCECCISFYVDMSGTSMSAPHITGVIALMLHKNPNLTHTEIRDLLRSNPTAKPSDSTPDEDVGWGAGKVNAKAVIDKVTQVNPPIPFAIVEPVAVGLEALRDRFMQTERGPVLSGLFPKHAQEVLALVNNNKKVATVWHRCKGPAWTRLAMRALYTPQESIPTEVDGLQLRDAVRTFVEIVKKYASPAFLEDILRYEPELNRFEEGMSLNNLIELAGADSHTTCALVEAELKV